LLVLGAQFHPLLRAIALLAVLVTAAIAMIVGFGLILVGGVGMIVVAFEEDTSCGLLYLFVPGYSLYYLVTRWDETRYPKLAALGMLLILGGLVMLFGMTALLVGV
jgi:hypothetical protein